MNIDPLHDAITAFLVAVITFCVRLLDRKGNPVKLGRVDELEERIDARLDSLSQSNQHRRLEVSQMQYELREIKRRMDSASDA